MDPLQCAMATICGELNRGMKLKILTIYCMQHYVSQRSSALHGYCQLVLTRWSSDWNYWREGSQDKTRKELSITGGWAGCAGDADDLSELPDHEQGTISTIKVKLTDSSRCVQDLQQESNHTC